MARTPQSGLIYLDTHVLLWLHDGLVDKLSPAAVHAIESAGQLLISPMAELEIQYLHEIGRFRPNPAETIAVLEAEIGLQRSSPSFAAVVATALALHWTRDPFDRLVVAEAIAVGAGLVTRDSAILDQCQDAIW